MTARERSSHSLLLQIQCTGWNTQSALRSQHYFAFGGMESSLTSRSIIFLKVVCVGPFSSSLPCHWTSTVACILNEALPPSWMECRDKLVARWKLWSTREKNETEQKEPRRFRSRKFMVVGVHNLDFAYKQVAHSTNHGRALAHKSSVFSHTFLITRPFPRLLFRCNDATPSEGHYISRATCVIVVQHTCDTQFDICSHEGK